jgi:hypothetical protein
MEPPTIMANTNTPETKMQVTELKPGQAPIKTNGETKTNGEAAGAVVAQVPEITQAELQELLRDLNASKKQLYDTKAAEPLNLDPSHARVANNIVAMRAKHDDWATESGDLKRRGKITMRQVLYAALEVGLRSVSRTEMYALDRCAEVMKDRSLKNLRKLRDSKKIDFQRYAALVDAIDSRYATSVESTPEEHPGFKDA